MLVQADGQLGYQVWTHRDEASEFEASTHARRDPVTVARRSLFGPTR